MSAQCPKCSNPLTWISVQDKPWEDRVVCAVGMMVGCGWESRFMDYVLAVVDRSRPYVDDPPTTCSAHALIHDQWADLRSVEETVELLKEEGL